MELGNMIFGNSRGEYPVPRDRSFEGPWAELCERLGIDSYGFREADCVVPETEWSKTWGGVENDTFRVMSYDWNAECDCGAEGKMEAWHEGHSHGPSCYQTHLRTAMAEFDARTGFKEIEAAAFGRNDDADDLLRGFNTETETVGPVTTMVMMPRTDGAMDDWRAAHDQRRKYEEVAYKRLCKEHGLPYPNGCAVHCDCGYDRSAELFWTEIGGHSATCRLMQPNFLYKPTGFQLNWYKYPFRDSYMSENLKPANWREIIRACIASVPGARP